MATLRGQPLGSLSIGDLQLLASVVDKRRPDLLPLLEKSDDLARSEAVELVNAVGEEVSDIADDDSWEPDSYGTRLERLLDAINRHRMP